MRKRSHKVRQFPSAGFTLPEVVISMTLTVLVTAGVMSTVLMFTGSSYRVSFYTDMEAESRKTLELFGEDVRLAMKAVWNGNASSVTLKVPLDATTAATEDRTYTFTAAGRKFTRTTPAGTQVLLTNIDTCLMTAYGLSGDPNDPVASRIFDPTSSGVIDWTIAGNNTKQIQLNVVSSQGGGVLAKATQKVISARFILRNKGSS